MKVGAPAPAHKKSRLRLCNTFIYSSEVRFLNCSWGRRDESNKLLPGPGSWRGIVGKTLFDSTLQNSKISPQRGLSLEAAKFQGVQVHPQAKGDT